MHIYSTRILYKTIYYIYLTEFSAAFIKFYETFFRSNRMKNYLEKGQLDPSKVRSFNKIKHYLIFSFI